MSLLSHLNNAGRQYQEAADYEQANHLAHRRGGGLGNIRNLYSDHNERLGNQSFSYPTDLLLSSLV